MLGTDCERKPLAATKMKHCHKTAIFEQLTGQYQVLIKMDCSEAGSRLAVTFVT
jgi:hypothetical protein